MLHGSRDVIGVVATLVLVLAVVATGFRAASGDEGAGDEELPAAATVAPRPAEPDPFEPAPMQSTALPAATDEAEADASTPLLVVDPSGPNPAASEVASQMRRVDPLPVGPGTGDSADERFASHFPTHVAATEQADDPASQHWAVLIGVNEHTGGISDNVGSRQDAEALYTHLIESGWEPDHVLLLTDSIATHENIVAGLQWLAARTSEQSTVAVWYSGHAQRWGGYDVNRDGQPNRIGIWPTDSNYVTDGELIRLLDEIRSERMWLNIMACHSAQFIQDGLVQDGRLVTVTAGEDEKSYEDPSVGQTVWGWNMVSMGMLEAHADRNGDGEVTVQEGVQFALPRAAERTRLQQPYGAQNAQMFDRSGGPFSLEIPDE